MSDKKASEPIEASRIECPECGAPVTEPGVAFICMTPRRESRQYRVPSRFDSVGYIEKCVRGVSDDEILRLVWNTVRFTNGGQQVDQAGFRTELIHALMRSRGAQP